MKMKSIIFNDKNEFASSLIAAGLANSLATYIAYMVLPEGMTLAADFGSSGEFLGRFEVFGVIVDDHDKLLPIEEALNQLRERDDPHLKVMGTHYSLKRIIFRLTCSLGPDSPDTVAAAQYMELANKFHKE